MTFEDLGYNSHFEMYRKENNLEHFGFGRIILEHKERYFVKTPEKEMEAEIIGNLRFTARSRADFPAVGDWVAISEFDENKALIHAVFPRKTIIERQAVGKHGEKQIIATNIDVAFIVQAVDRDFNINRIERYLAICTASKVTPIILLNKTDLIAENERIEIIEKVKQRIKNVSIFEISNYTKSGFSVLEKTIEKGKTYCLLGSSGVGKSTLLNNLAGKQLMKTNTISESNLKGRHVTSHRELVVLENGGIIIDNPGMREVGITDAANGLETVFGAILELEKNCKYNDCTHTSENGCAVLEAVENGILNENSYHNYLKIEREKEFFESTVAERRKKDKDFGKIVKNFKNIKNRNKL